MLPNVVQGIVQITTMVDQSRACGRAKRTQSPFSSNICLTNVSVLEESLGGIDAQLSMSGIAQDPGVLG